MMKFSICISVGKYARFNFEKGKTYIRICFGWIAFALAFYDIEEFMSKLIDENIEYQKTIYFIKNKLQV